MNLDWGRQANLCEAMGLGFRAMKWVGKGIWKREERARPEAQGQKCMLTLVKSIETRLAGAKGSYVGSKRRLDGQTIGGFECWRIRPENRALLFLSKMHSHSANYMVFYESI